MVRHTLEILHQKLRFQNLSILSGGNLQTRLIYSFDSETRGRTVGTFFSDK